MDFKKLNLLAEKYLPLRKLIDLEQTIDFKVTEVRKVKGQYGMTVVLSIDYEFQTFLPKKYYNFFTKYPEEYEKFQKEILSGKAYMNHLGFGKLKFFSKETNEQQQPLTMMNPEQ